MSVAFRMESQGGSRSLSQGILSVARLSPWLGKDSLFENLTCHVGSG